MPSLETWQQITNSTQDLYFTSAQAENMYSPIYLLMKLTPYLLSVGDGTARLWLYHVNEFVNSTENQVICPINSFDTFDSRVSMIYNVPVNSLGVHLVDVWIYSLLMEQTGCSNSSECLMLCSLYHDGQPLTERQTLFFARSKDLKLDNPNLRTVSIQQRSLNEIDFTIKADKPALFVWLDIPDEVSAYFSRNGFHIFESEVTVTFISWTSLINVDSANINLSITSLYDFTQP